MSHTLDALSHGYSSNLIEATSWLDDLKGKKLLAFNSMHFEDIQIIKDHMEPLPHDKEGAYAKNTLVKQ